MDSNTLKGKWRQLKGSAKEQWGELTEDDLQKIDGNLDQLMGTIQEKYGKTKEDVKREVDQWLEESEFFENDASETETPADEPTDDQ